jgi:hypothetical protein
MANSFSKHQVTMVKSRYSISSCKLWWQTKNIKTHLKKLCDVAYQALRVYEKCLQDGSSCIISLYTCHIYTCGLRHNPQVTHKYIQVTFSFSKRRAKIILLKWFLRKHNLGSSTKPPETSCAEPDTSLFEECNALLEFHFAGRDSTFWH